LNKQKNLHTDNAKKKRRRWPWFLLLGILLFVAIARLSLNTDFVREIAKNQIISTANPQLTVKLDIDRLEGDLWKEAVLQGISLTESVNGTGADTLASIQSLELGYDLLSYFGSVFEISHISIRDPYLKFQQRDGSINVEGWMAESQTSEEAESSEPFPIQVERFTISDGKIDALIASLPGDSSFVADEINLNSSFSLLAEGYEATIRDFSFSLLETPLGDPVTVETQLSAEKQSISLQKLVVATGSSILQSEGSVNAADSSGNISFQALPLAWSDIAAYVDDFPIRENLQLSLNIRGNAHELYSGLEAETTGIEDFEAGVTFSWADRFEVKRINLQASLIDLAGFLGDSTLPSMRQVRMDARGGIPVNDYQNGNINGTLSIGPSRFLSYSVDSLMTSYTLSGSSAEVEARAAKDEQSLQANLNADKIWEEGSGPDFRLTANGRNIEPAYWLQNESYEGRLSFSGEVNGNGYSPAATPWGYRLNFNEGVFAGQDFQRIATEGTITGSRITNLTTLRLIESELSLSASVENYAGIPQFNYRLETSNFDLSEFRNLESFSTDLGLTLEGSGSGSSLQNLRLTSTIRMDSSVINGGRVHRLVADISVADTVVTVDPAELRSTIAEGSFDARFHLERWYDIGNELNLNLTFKDLQALAPLAGIETLNAEGSIKGKLAPIYDNRLKFGADINLKDIAYNDQFTSEAATGNVEVFVVEEPEFVLGIDLQSPSFTAVQLRDLYLQTRGKFATEELDGDFELNFKGPNESEIVHSGSYSFGEDSLVVITEQYELITYLRTLLLERPFRVVLKDGALEMEPMRLSSGDGAILELAIPYADSTRQQGYLIGDNLDMSAIQSALLSESYFEGILSGNLAVANTDSSFEAKGKLLISDLDYQGTYLELLNLELDIGNEKLSGNLLAEDEGKELMSGSLNLPFRLGDPQEFDESFFEQPVDGHFELRPVALSRFDSLLARMGVLDTEGILQVSAGLKGTAGQPQFVSSMKLDSAVISGVNVDSLTTNLEYVHEQSSLSLSATVNSLKQRAAEINAEVPFYLDLKNGEVMVPGEEDSVSVDIRTNNFNLAAFNDFVDRNRVRNIRGTIDGMVHVEGKLSELDSRGEMKLSNASVRIVQTGITVDGVEADFIFSPDRFSVNNFRARSGSGSMNMNGTIGFQDLVPGDMNITLGARNFRIANTSQLNAAINLDSKIGGSFTNPEISGSLSVLNGFVELDNFGEKSVESVQLDESVEPETSMAVYDSLSLDLEIAFNRRFFIRNQRYLEMEVELDGSVDMLKDPGDDLQMFGTLETVNGYARPLGKRFELEEGVVTFTGNPENPGLRIRTLFEPIQPEEEIMIWYIIEGTVEEPQFKYESSPPMELEDILCYTLFGQPCYALESWKRAVASSGSNSTATDLALDIFMDRIESLATQRLGIDVVRIDNTHSGGETGTSITTGWYINPKVFFAVQNVITGSTPDTGFLLEYLLKKNLKLIISQGSDARQGVDLKWNYDY